ncbi:Cdc37, partial [Symbiodinium necroappetens]
PPPPQYTSDVGEDKSLADGRRSRQNRRQAQEDWMDRQPGPDTRGTPSAAERERSGPFFGAGSMSATSKGSRAVAPQHGPSGVYSTGHSHAAFGHGTSSLLGGGSASGCSGGVGLCLAPGAGVGSMGGGSGCSGGLAHPGGAAVRAAEKHVSAGTGGSEEWPSTQARNARALRENDYEDEKAVWAQGCALPLMKKAGRNQAPLGQSLMPDFRPMGQFLQRVVCRPSAGAEPIPNFDGVGVIMMLSDRLAMPIETRRRLGIS